jgi:hypothetical protein
MKRTWSLPCGRAGRSWMAGVAALVLCGWSGCGGEPFKLVPVAGKITYADGSLIPGEQILVRFIPEQAPTVGKDVVSAATGEVNPQDGTFEGLTTHKYLDGAVPGPNKVTVVALKTGPDGTLAPTKAVPEKYQSAETTPLKWDVVAGKPAELKIEKGR